MSEIIAQSTLYYTAWRAEKAMLEYAEAHSITISSTISLERQEAFA